jgi:hypothetical protein
MAAAVLVLGKACSMAVCWPVASAQKPQRLSPIYQSGPRPMPQVFRRLTFQLLETPYSK